MDARWLAQRLLPWLRERTGRADLRFGAPIRLFTDGFENRVFGLELQGAPAALSGPLVLRLFHAHDEPERARVEATIMDTVAGQGFPAPRPRLAVEEPEPLGAPFVLMDHVPGRGLGIWPRALELNAALLHRLHALDPEPLRRALVDAGLSPESFRFAARLQSLRRLTDRDGLRGLLPAADWLEANAPPAPERPVICHGDLLMDNIRCRGGRVTGVIDWSSHYVTLCEPALDAGVVAATWLGFRVPLPGLGAPSGVVMRLVTDRFLRAWGRGAPFDRDRVLYFGLYRVAGILCSTLAATRGIPGTMRLGNAGNFLTRPAVLEGYARFFEQHTGTRLAL